MGAQWFPKVGVLWNGAWNCHQYHLDTEFFSDFGTYNVNITLPQRYTVGASVSRQQNKPIPTAPGPSASAAKMYRLRLAASPHFQVADDVFE